MRNPSWFLFAIECGLRGRKKRSNSLLSVTCLHCVISRAMVARKRASVAKSSSEKKGRKQVKTEIDSEQEEEDSARVRFAPCCVFVSCALPRFIVCTDVEAQCG